jgi:hypothetical protein
MDRIGQRAFFRPVGVVTLETGIDMIVAAIGWAREQQVHDIVVNTHGLRGFNAPSTFARYDFGRRIAEAAGAVHVAVVIAPELIDPQKLGALVAQNRGLTGDVFASEAAALEWLDARA